MRKYILRRLLIGVFLLFIVSLLTFGLTKVIPGDAIDALESADVAGNTTVIMTKAIREQMERLYGLDKPLPVQYADWVSRLSRGDLGRSQKTSFPIYDEIVLRIGPTVELTLAAMAIGLFIGISLGVLTAIKHDTAYDYFGTIFSLLGVAIPNFLLGTVLVLAFAIWLPIQINVGYVPFFDDPVEHFKRMILPAVTLGFSSAAILTRLTRTSLLEVMDQDYIRTARSKGVSEGLVIWRHALRNSMIPILTVAGLQFGGLLGGTVIVETIFSWPGLGIYLIDSVGNRDYPVLQILLLLFTSIFVLVNLIVDITYGYVDPRIRYD